MRKEQVIWDRIAKSFHVTSTNSLAHKDKYIKIAKIILKQKPSFILDLGCGSGILEKELIDSDFQGRILAIDASLPMLKIAKKTINNPRCEFVEGDLDKSIKTNVSFDIIVSINLLFFLRKKELFFQSVEKCLKNKKSLFILVIPKTNKEASNSVFIKEHFKGLSWWEKPLFFVKDLGNIPHYFRMFFGQRKLSVLADRGLFKHDTVEDIKELAKQAGLDVAKVQEIQANQNWIFFIRRR